MNFLKSIFTNESVKQKIISSFISEFKNKGVKQVLIQIGEGENDIDIKIIDDAVTVVNKEIHDFLIKFYKENKDK